MKPKQPSPNDSTLILKALIHEQELAAQRLQVLNNIANTGILAEHLLDSAEVLPDKITAEAASAELAKLSKLAESGQLQQLAEAAKKVSLSKLEKKAGLATLSEFGSAADLAEIGRLSAFSIGSYAAELAKRDAALNKQLSSLAESVGRANLAEVGKLEKLAEVSVTESMDETRRPKAKKKSQKK